MPPNQLAFDFSISTESLLLSLRAWSEAGWLRHLDTAFANFIARLAPQSRPEVLLAAALLAHLEGRGHTCLDIQELQAAPQSLLAWPEEAAQALDAILHTLPADWTESLRTNPAVQVENDTHQPLVFEGSRLYLRRYWHYEQQVAHALRIRANTRLEADIAQQNQILAQLFPSQAGSLNWQKIACAIAMRSTITIITGGPGTGKTYTVARLLALLLGSATQPETQRIALAAPTGKAAARLKQSIDQALGQLGKTSPQLVKHLDKIGSARTLHSLLGAHPESRHFRHHAANPLDIDVLIVDEASMIHLEMMAALLDALPPHARLILLGDKDQLASVEAGAVLGDICREAESGHYNELTHHYISDACQEILPSSLTDSAGGLLAQQTVMLRESRRFSGSIGQLAQAINQGKASLARDCLQKDSAQRLAWEQSHHPRVVVKLALQGRSAAPGGYRSYLELLGKRPQTTDSEQYLVWIKSVLLAFDRFRILCALREGEWGVAGLNQAIESALQEASLIHKRGEWYSGRPVMITRNDYSAQVFNGDIGIALPAENQSMRVWFLDGEEVRSVLASRLASVETAYAMTVHKSQGSEFEHTVLVLPSQAGKVLARELVYTGITRARQYFTLVAAEDRILTQAIEQKTHRASGLAEKLS